MNELLSHLNREEVQTKLTRVEPEFNIAESIADELSLTVYDQPDAAQAVGKRLAMWQSGLTEPDKPIGVLFFVGPPGVGKTEMGTAVANWFGLPPEHLIRLDMSDYQEPHTAQKLTGSPPGYVGHSETPALPHDILNSNKPTVVILDEIEKAHDKVLKGLLQAFDKGELNARNGERGFETVDLTRAIFLMTSNLASDKAVDIEKRGIQRIGFGRNEGNREEEIERVIKQALKDKFPPEFLDRVDQFVRFRPIESDSTRHAILTKFIGEINGRFQDRWGGEAPYLDLTDEARQAIVAQKDDKGGRGIKRVFQQMVVSQLPNVMMGMDYHRRPFIADVEDGKAVWYTDTRIEQEEEWDSRALPVPQPELRKIEGGKKSTTPTPIGNRVDSGKGPHKVNVAGGEDEEIPEEEETPSEISDFGDIPPQDDEEDVDPSMLLPVKREGANAVQVRLSSPYEKGRYSMTEAITIYDGDKPILAQILNRIPLVELGEDE